MSKNSKKQVFEIIRTHRKMVTELEESGLETISSIAGAIVKSDKERRDGVYLRQRRFRR